MLAFTMNKGFLPCTSASTINTTGTLSSGYHTMSVKSSIGGIGWDNLSKRTPNDTVTDHYLHFIHKNLDE